MSAMKAGKSGSDSGGEAAASESGAGVGRLVDSSQADDRRMIRLVRARRLLYARNNMPVASYYSQVKELWKEVATEMGWTVAEVRRKWSHIRNSYSRHLRNELHGVRTGRGRMVSRWYLADELAFLRDHMATDTRPCRYSYAPLYMDSGSEEPPPAPSPAPPSPEQPDIKPFMAGSWFALSQPSPQHLEHRQPQPRPGDPASPPHSFDADENSAYFQFFRGIYNDYQELPATKQRLFRRECLSFLHRLLDEEETVRGGGGSDCAINLSNSHRAAAADVDDTDTALCVISEVGGCMTPQ